MNEITRLRHTFKCEESFVFDPRPRMPHEFVMRWLSGEVEWCREFLRARHEVGVPLDHTLPGVGQ